MLSATLTALAFALYLAAAVCYGAVLSLHAPAAPSPSGAAPAHLTRYGRPFLLAGIAVQFVAVGAWCVTTRRSPFASEYGTLAVWAWAIALAFAALDFRARLPAVGAVALPVACAALFWGVLHARSPIAETPLLTGQIVSLHVLAILASFGLFVAAFGCAALYLLQNRLLKARKVNGLFRRLPPLETLDTVAFHAVAFALPLLTIGLALGMVRAFGGGLPEPPAAWLTDFHNLAGIATWLLYVFYLGARLLAGWRGVRLQYILVLGFLIALALFIVPSSTHRFI
jgi:ABC-type transport system involved in cytochrome c biogenesis permease subunit